MKAAVAGIRDGIRANRERPVSATAKVKALAVSVQKVAAPKKKASVAKRALSAKKGSTQENHGRGAPQDCAEGHREEVRSPKAERATEKSGSEIPHSR